MNDTVPYCNIVTVSGEREFFFNYFGKGKIYVFYLPRTGTVPSKVPVLVFFHIKKVHKFRLIPGIQYRTLKKRLKYPEISI